MNPWLFATLLTLTYAQGSEPTLYLAEQTDSSLSPEAVATFQRVLEHHQQLAGDPFFVRFRKSSSQAGAAEWLQSLGEESPLIRTRGVALVFEEKPFKLGVAAGFGHPELSEETFQREVNDLFRNEARSRGFAAGAATALLRTLEAMDSPLVLSGKARQEFESARLLEAPALEPDPESTDLLGSALLLLLAVLGPAALGLTAFSTLSKEVTYSMDGVARHGPIRLLWKEFRTKTHSGLGGESGEW